MDRRWILLSLVLMAPLLFLSSGRTSADKPPPPSNQMRIANSLSCTDDAFEENDDRRTAPHLWDRGEILGDGIGYYLAICSGDNDWFAVDAMQSVALTVYIEFINADGDLDLYLYGPDGTLITQSVGVSDFEAISYTPTETNTYYIQVVGYSGAENIYLMGMQGSCDHCRFSYQGQLQVEDAPANGEFDFQFALYDLPAGGNLLKQRRMLRPVVGDEFA